jgi:hypothetical protein
MVGWALLVAALLAWEGLGLADGTGRWPTMSELLRAVSANTLGRWLLFALWLWLGWHLFVRGWRFFLRA